MIGEISGLRSLHGWTNARFELSVACISCSRCRLCWSIGSLWRTRCISIRPCKCRGRCSGPNPVFPRQSRNRPARSECSTSVDLSAAARALPDPLRQGFGDNQRKEHQAPPARCVSSATDSCLFRVNARLGHKDTCAVVTGNPAATCPSGSLPSARHRQDIASISQ